MKLTERHLNIPRAMACKYAAGARSAGIDLDELESVGNLALVEAAHRFDPTLSPNGMEGLGGFLAQAVEWKVRNTIWPEESRREAKSRRMASLDAKADDDGASLLDILSEDAPPETALEMADEVQSWLRRLRPRERALVRLVRGEGLTLAQAGARLGVSKQAACVALAKAERRLRKSRGGVNGSRPGMGARGAVALAEWREAHPDLAAAQYRRGRERGAIGRHLAADARRALGRIAPTRTYLLDREARTAWGDWRSLVAALAAVGVRMPPRSRSWPAAVLGWADLSSAQANVLSHLIERGSGTWRSLLGLPGVPATVRDVCTELVGMGLLSSPGARGGGVLAIYAATDLARSSRGPTTHLVPVRGRSLAKMEGVKVLPPHLVGKVVS